jgi:DNA replication protein DnaC
MKTKANTLLLESYLKTLRLPMMLAEYPGVVRQCAEKDATYDLFLEHLAELEVNSRATKATERRLKQARFPMAKELSEFDFSAVPKLNKAKILELARCEFIDERANLVFLSAPGTGKSHLAVAIGREACRCGHRVKFFTAAGLANLYREAWDERQILRFEAGLRRLDAIVVDELGYVPLDKAGAEHLFGFFSQCYERTSLIITTNLPFAEWPTTFAGDERLTGALLDRLTHRVHIVEIKGDSYRLKSSMKTTKRGTPSGGRTATKKQS